MECIVTVAPKDGLRARPVSQPVETVNPFDADIQLGRADEDDLVPAASMLAVTDLGVGHSEEIRLVADGDDAEAALNALEAVLSTPEADDEEQEPTVRRSRGGLLLARIDEPTQFGWFGADQLSFR